MLPQRYFYECGGSIKVTQTGPEVDKHIQHASVVVNRHVLESAISSCVTRECTCVAYSPFYGTWGNNSIHSIAIFPGVYKEGYMGRKWFLDRRYLPERNTFSNKEKG